MTNPRTPPPGTVPSRSAEGEVDDLFADMVREFAREGGVREELSDEEIRYVHEQFAIPDEEYRPLPPEGTPEFLAEMQRRLESPHPALSARTVVAWLRARKAADPGNGQGTHAGLLTTPDTST